MNNEALTAKIDAYCEAREAYDVAKKLSDEADKHRRDRERELVDYMIENQIKKVALANGLTPLLVNSVSIACNQENAEQLREWLRETTGDDADYMVTVLHKPAVLAYVKKRIEEGDDPTDFPDYLKCDTRPTLRVDGWKGR